MDDSNPPIESTDPLGPRPAARLFALLAVGAVVIGSLWVLVFSRKPPPASKVRTAKLTKPIQVGKGLPVSAMLLTPLQSDGSAVGLPVRLVVAQNVAAPDGTIVIPAGTAIEGEVSKVRGAGALSGLMNSPARLEIRLKPLETAPQGYSFSEPLQWVSIAGAEIGAYSFTRDNTGKVETASLVRGGIEDEVTIQLLAELSQALERGDAPPELARLLAANVTINGLMQRPELAELKQWSAKRDSAEAGISSLLDVARELKSGNLRSLAAPDITLALGAIQELGGLASGASDLLKGIVKGRNIRAHIGTQVELATANEVVLEPRS